MDSIIPLIIMLIVGALLSGKKKKSSQKEEAKPFTAQQRQPEQEGPVKKLKDMYKEIQQEMEQESQRKQPTADNRPMTVPSARAQIESLPKSVELPVSSKTEAKGGSKSRSRKSTRGQSTRGQSTRGQSTRVVQKEQNILQVESIIPKSKDDLIKGVIFSEIYGPPKSKR